MLALTAQQTRDLALILAEAAEAYRELAANESYRATACKSIRDRVMVQYHSNRAEAFMADAKHVQAAADRLAAAKQTGKLRAVSA